MIASVALIVRPSFFRKLVRQLSFLSYPEITNDFNDKRL